MNTIQVTILINNFKSAAHFTLIWFWNYLHNRSLNCAQLSTDTIANSEATCSTFKSLVRNLFRPPRWSVVLSFNKKWLTCHVGKTYKTPTDVKPGCWGWSFLPGERSVERTSKHLAILTSRAVTFSLQEAKQLSRTDVFPFCCMWVQLYREWNLSILSMLD